MESPIKITWDMARIMNKNRPVLQHKMAPEWLVELTAIETSQTDMKIVEIVQARDKWEAAWLGLQTRNMPDNWIVTGVERA